MTSSFLFTTTMLYSINIQSSIFQNIIIVCFIGGPVNIGGRFCISSESEETIKGIGTGIGVSENYFFLHLEEEVLV